jgi:hypothetical protein
MESISLSEHCLLQIRLTEITRRERRDRVLINLGELASRELERSGELVG